MNPEARLAVAVSSPAREPEAIELAVQDIRRWDAVIELAERHDITGLLAAAFDGRFAAIRKAAVHRDRTQALVLGGILDRFRDAGIPLMLLKGIGFAERLYTEPSERPSADLDILVREADMEAAGKILERLELAPLRPGYFERNHFHIPYFGREGPPATVVELHWDVTFKDSPVRFSMDGWWKRARTARLRAGEVLLPPLEDELVYTAYHAFSRGAVTLRDLGDVARLRLAAKDHLNEEIVEGAATRAGALAFMNQAHLLGSRLWNIFPGDRPKDDAARWISRNIIAPQTIVAVGSRAWWPYRKICYWSLLPQRGPGDLLRSSLEDWTGPGSVPRKTPALVHKGRKLLSLTLALGLCCLPHSLFPPSPRPL